MGYDLYRATRKLFVNEPEAKRVWQIFQLYLKNQALLPDGLLFAAQTELPTRPRTRTGERADAGRIGRLGEADGIGAQGRGSGVMAPQHHYSKG